MLLLKFIQKYYFTLNIKTQIVERKENQLNLQYFTNYKVVHFIYMFMFVEQKIYIIESQYYKLDFSNVHFSTLPHEIIVLRLAG
jgi:hypothetical protein